MEFLSNREQYELDVCLQNINLFNKYINDYQSLRNKLNNLADKTRHDIMVPIGGTKYAFMPGYIHHTNEILVLLGENIFVEKSAKESIEFIDRRIKFCQEKLSELEKQKSMLQKWMETTDHFKEENSQFVNITETCTDEEFNQWMKEHNEKCKQQSRSKSSNKNDKIDMDEFFKKYEDNEQKTVKIIKDKGPSFQHDIIEKIGPELSENKPSSKTNTSLQRPISKFKASRNKKENL